MFIPETRTVYRKLKQRQRQMNGREFQHLPALKTKKKKDMVLIPFRHAPSHRRFRYRGDWWRKTSFRGGTICENSKDSFHEFELPPEEPVGVYLKDLEEPAQAWILK